MAHKNDLNGDFSSPPEFGEEDISLASIPPLDPSAGKPERFRGASKFAPGDLLANRYRVLKLIAHGGMGEVYEAEDLELQQNIAIKTILPSIVNEPKALALLKLEVQLSLKVTHPNVCRIFNLDCHRATSPEVAPVWFVTMELLQGHTLSHEIKTVGRLSTERALPIADQMANGLEAARRANIVHGDFKSGNVLLVSTGDGSIRVVITDFGLALALDDANNSRAAKVGTPAYMAPEQVTGGELSPQTDVYSFGVVLYEMLTGQWPFNADTPDRIAAKRLTESPTPPVRFVPNLDPVWNRAILKCLAREPSQRYISARSAIDEITGRSRFRRRRVIVAASVLFIALAAGILARYKELGPFRPKPEVAVMGWRNRSGDPSQAWVATELSERLTSALQQSTTDNVIPQEEVEHARMEFSVPADKDLELEDLVQFRTALGANTFIAGSYDVHNDTLVVDGILQNAMGRSLARFHEEGPIQNLTQVVSQVASKLGNQLDRAPATNQSANIYPRSPQGRKLYFEALERLQSFDAEGARAKLQQVVELDGDSIAAHSSLAEAWFYLKRDNEAAAEANKAAKLAHAQDLPFELAHETEARLAEMEYRWADAVKEYEVLHNKLPSRLNYSLKYAESLNNNQQPAESLRFLDQLAKNPPPVGDDPRIQIRRTADFLKLGDFTSGSQAAKIALDESVARKLKLVEASAQQALCWVQTNQGHDKEAADACEAAYVIYAASGDYVSAQAVQGDLATIRTNMGDYSGAMLAYQTVLDATRKAGAMAETDGTLLNLADVEIRAGNLDSAQTHISESLQIAKQVGDVDDEARAHVTQATLFETNGQLTQSNQELENASSLAKTIGDVAVQGYVESNLGKNALEAGDLKSAQQHTEEAIRLRKQTSQQVEVAVALDRLGNVFVREAKFDLAREKYNEALAIHKQLNQLARQADVLLDLADLDIAEGHPEAAIDRANPALRIFHEDHQTISEAETHILLAEAYVELKRYEDAEGELKTARAFQSHDEVIQPEIDLAQAALLTQTNHADQARLLAQGVADDARKSGDKETELEAELEVLKAKWQLETDRKVLDRLTSDFRKEAENAGFKDLALKASQMN